MSPSLQTGGPHRVFALLLFLLPRDFRHHFGGEMRAVFADQLVDAEADGRLAYVRFWLDTVAGVIATAARAHADIFVGDAVFAFRVIRKDTAFMISAMTVLGLAIGAASAAFLAANAILLRPLPFSSGDRLVQLTQTVHGEAVASPAFSVQEIGDLRQAKSFESVIEYHEMPFTLLGGREPLRVDTGVVSANFFRALGVKPLYGRDFFDDDDRPGALPVLVLSHQFWERVFHGDPDVVGRRFRMNDHEHVVIGVLPPVPQFPEVVDVYMPTAACPSRSSAEAVNNRSRRMSNAFATLKANAGLERAQEELHTVAERQRSMHADFYPGTGHDILLTPETEHLRRDIRPILVALAAASGLLLLLACFNTAGLMVSRMLARSRDLGIRSALGASSARLVRSYITEGLVLAFMGGVVGLGLLTWSIGLLVRLTSKFTTLSTQLQLGADVLAFWFLLTAAVGVFLGIAPAVGIKTSSLWGLPLARPAALRRTHVFQRMLLVSGQLALAVVLLVASGLALRTLVHLQRLDGGFQSESIMTARFYVMNSDSQVFFTKLLDRTRGLPGVQDVALTDSVPLTTRAPNSSLFAFRVRGENARTPRLTHLCSASRDYFRVIGMRVIEGRSFDVSDEGEPIRVAVINEHMARRYWGNESPVGKEVSAFRDHSGADVWVKIIGVVSDVRQAGLDKEPIDELIFPWEQSHNYVMSLVVRASGPLDTLAGAIPWIAHDIAPDVAVTDIQTMNQVRTESLVSPRTTATFLTVFAVIALAITASGISGMMALMVNDRRQEIGIRLALGATPGAVMRGMFFKVAPAMCGGVLVGLLAAWWLSRAMNDIVIGVSVRDSLTFATSSVVLAATAVLFAVAPLTHISQMDPSTPLRAE